MNKISIQPVSEIEADKRRLCEIKFDCYVTMHDSGGRQTEGGWLTESRSLPPQWFRLNSQITLESIKHLDAPTLGLQLKQMLYELEKSIEKYEQYQ
jgi:hypothetical protein